MSTVKRRHRSYAGRRAFGGRTVVALVAAATLILGPGAMSAFADDSVPVDPAATAEVSPAAPVADPAPQPEAPAPQPAAAPAEEAPAPDASPAPAAPEAPPVPAPPADGAGEAALPDGGSADPAAPAEDADPPAAAVAMGGDEEEIAIGNIPICHATGAVDHWVVVPASKTGDVEGHAGMSHQDGRDIIPPFEYSHDGMIALFPGQNWDAAGQAIYANDCELPPPPPPNPVVEVTVDQCVDPDGEVPGTVAIAISSLVEGFEYELVVTGPGGFESTTPLTPEGGVANVTQAINGPGDYLATVTGYPWVILKSSESSEIPAPPTVSGSQEFTVDECPPPPPPTDPVVTVEVNQCVPPNGVVPGTVGITITGLLEGIEYTLVVTGPDGFDSGEITVSPVDGAAFIEQPIPGPGDYLATVTGTWWTIWYPDDVARVISEDDEEHWEEHTVTGMQEFTVNPDCAVTPPATIVPTLPITSSPPPIKALAVTGAPADGSSAAPALLLLLGAAAALLATGARQARRSRL